MNKKQIAITIASTMFAMAAGSASADSATSSFQVQAKVDPACQISSTGVNFGNYDPAGTAALYKSGTVTVTCVKDTASTVELDMGVKNNRSMTSADPLSGALTYQLFKPAAGAAGVACTETETDVWGSLADNTALAVAAAPDNTSRTFSVCGKLGGGQNVSPGTYSDTITATVNF